MDIILDLDRPELPQAYHIKSLYLLQVASQ